MSQAPVVLTVTDIARGLVRSNAAMSESDIASGPVQSNAAQSASANNHAAEIDNGVAEVVPTFTSLAEEARKNLVNSIDTRTKDCRVALIKAFSCHIKEALATRGVELLPTIRIQVDCRHGYEIIEKHFPDKNPLDRLTHIALGVIAEMAIPYEILRIAWVDKNIYTYSEDYEVRTIRIELQFANPLYGQA